MKRHILVFLILITITKINSQSRFELFPDNLSIQPFAANTLEPKLGFLFQTYKNELRLDIGNSLDFLRFDSGNETFTFGADLFTYTLLRGEENFHFPVDAVDYLFGINGSYKNVKGNHQYGLRLRISHISAHFVDGHYDGAKQQWRNGLNPRVYSREFVELMPFYSYKNLRLYGGYAFIFHVEPSSIGKDNYQTGFDFYAIDLITDFITPFVGYDMKITHIKEYNFNHSVVFGIKTGKPNGKGLSAYFNFYSGKSIHGEYFDFDKNYWAFGINIDL